MKLLRARFLFFILPALVGVLLDLWTKHLAFAHLGRPGEREVYWLFEQIFGFQTSLNQGALFGLGQGLLWVFVPVSLAAVIGIVFWVIIVKENSKFHLVVLGLITAGILGNLWDRLALHSLQWTSFDVLTGMCSSDRVGTPIHAVRDWILVMIGSYHWPNFNLADSYLVCGAILMMLEVTKDEWMKRFNKISLTTEGVQKK